ncbi:MAG: PQQ-binding-like beta-propeller repeat protein [Acidobacteria bacterium]|nr:PQQ-binding-like beta-propeller repeat protein [Acidobacteriota bacterium]
MPIFVLLLVSAAAHAQDTAGLYLQRCGICHNESNSRAPSLETMRGRSTEAILTALVSGPMRVQGAKLSGVERRALAEHITGKKLSGDATGSATGRCATHPAMDDIAKHPQWNGWGAGITNTRFATAQQAGLTAAGVPKLKLRWAFGFPDATLAWAQPSLAGGRVFVGSHNGTVYSLDAKTGCIHWVFSAKGGVRTAMSIGNGAVYFGDTTANAYALDVNTGRTLWIRQVDEHPLARITGSPVLHEGRLYVPLSSYEEAQAASPEYACCTFRGSLAALDAKTGAVRWKTYMIAGSSGAAIWSAPTVDTKRKLIYVATGNTYTNPPQPTSDALVALAMDTGKIQWTKQATPNDTFVIGCRPGSTNPNCPATNGPDYDFGNAPILTSINKRDLIVIGQKSGVGFAFDPDKSGEIVWQYRAGEGGALGGMEWGSAVDAQHAYFPVSDISRPKPGGLHAVDLATGKRVWMTPAPPLACNAGRGCNAAQSAAVTVIPGAVFSGSNDGALRAYSTKDGAILWEYNTNREFPTVNGVPATGGSLNGPGPAIAGGMLFANAGYGGFGGRPGNVLLAFAVE